MAQAAERRAERPQAAQVNKTLSVYFRERTAIWPSFFVFDVVVFAHTALRCRNRSSATATMMMPPMTIS